MANETKKRIRYEVEEEERWKRRLRITVPAPRVEDERERVTRRVASRMKLPGFRKGQIPPDLVEKRHGPAIRQQVLDTLVEEAYGEALREAELRPISPGNLEELDYEPGEDLDFAITFDVQPEIEIGRLGGFTVERPALEVGEEEIEKVLRRIREDHGVWKPAEGIPEEGDRVSVEIVPLDEEGNEQDEARPYEFTLGQGDAIPDVEEAIRSLETGEEGEFEVTFPEDFPNEERRGVTRRLRIRLVDRKVQELPELDDDFARSVGDFEEIDDLRAAVREDLAAEAEREAEAAVRRSLLDNLLEANAFEVPESMVDSYVEQYMQQVTGGDADELPEEQLEETRAAVRPDAERAVKRTLLVDRIAKTQGLEATDEELDERIAEIAEANDRPAAEIRAELRRRDRLGGIRRNITEAKVFAFLEEKSTIVEE